MRNVNNWELKLWKANTIEAKKHGGPASAACFDLRVSQEVICLASTRSESCGTLKNASGAAFVVVMAPTQGSCAQNATVTLFPSCSIYFSVPSGITAAVASTKTWRY